MSEDNLSKGPSATQPAGHYMWKEIQAQPNVAGLNLDDADRRLSAAAAWIRERSPIQVGFVGCGDSRFSGIAGRYAFSRWAGISAASHQAFDASAYLLDELSGGVLIAVSNSGESQKTAECASLAVARGIPVLAVTSEPTSRLARIADQVLLTILPDAPVAASHTTSHAALLATTLGLSARVARGRSSLMNDIHSCLESAPMAMQATLEVAGEAARVLADRHKNRDRWVLLGAGPHYATALAGAAKLYETAYSAAISENLEEYAHEQMFILRPRDPVLIVTSRGASQQRAIEIADGVSELGGEAVLISEVSAERLGNHTTLQVAPLREPIEEVTTLTNLLAMQCYAYHLALHRGEDPDRVRYFDVNMRLIGQGKDTQDIDKIAGVPSPGTDDA